MKPPSDRRLLAVLAHPDDESFGPGGTLALYAKLGVDVHLICATGGEAGDVPETLLEGYTEVKNLRLDELQCAAGHLGLTDYHLLGYRDSGMAGSPDNQHPEALAAAPQDEVAAMITTLMRQIRPQVVITFDPLGGYLHPDHMAIHRATVEAFHAAGNPQRFPDSYPPYQPQKLYFTVFPRRWVRVVVFLLPFFGQDPRRFGRNADIDLVKLTSQSFPIHTRVNIRPVIKEKSLAAACHQSQGGPPNSFVFRVINRLAPSNETFMRAHPSATKRTQEHDLFEGIHPDPIR